MGNPYVKPSDQEKPKAKKKDKWRQTELPKPLDDNLHYGDTSLLLKSENSSRLYFLNVNSIKAKNDFDHMSDICHKSAAAGIDFLLLAEVNINLREPNLRSTIKKHIDRVWENKMAWATATGKSASHTKPGGCISITRGDWTTQVTKTSQDKRGLGRWTTTLRQGKGAKRLAIICAYRVCQQSINRAGNTTAFAQQWHLLRQAGIDNLIHDNNSFTTSKQKYRN